MQDDNCDPEELRTKYQDLQKRSMSLFEIAYKKVRSSQSWAGYHQFLGNGTKPESGRRIVGK